MTSWLDLVGRDVVLQTVNLVLLFTALLCGIGWVTDRWK